MKRVHEEITDLLSDEDDRFSCPKEIRKKAMDFLARREYGQRELIRKLADKGYMHGLVESEIERLTQDGLQNDTRFAEAFVQSRIGQGKGPVRIRVDLGQKGIPDGVIEFAIEESGADWFEQAKAQRLKKFGSGQPADFKSKAKQMRFLQYRGFEQEHIQAALGD
ncbi:MAG: recombination regulator RecX [Gammaproteobacteria bacterium]|nr:recombination regulator RecX [Gammaproteobacteria bacterium]